MGALLPVILPVINGWLERLFPDPATRADELQKLMLVLQAWDQQQTEIDKVEAASPSVFVAGWRPMIGWFGALAIGYSYLAVPNIMWLCAAFGFDPPKPPTLDDHLYELVTLLLGAAGLRTYEKTAGLRK